MKGHTNDFIFGDSVVYRKDGEIRKDSILMVIEVQDHITVTLISKTGGKYVASKEELLRLPRAGEMILVKSQNNSQWQPREFIRFDCNRIDPWVKVVSYFPEEADNGYSLFYKDWKYINPREEKIKDLVKKIEKNDPETLEKMAELLLAALEKVS